MTNQTLIITVILLSAVLSLIKVRKSDFAKSVTDFFLADKKLSTSDFINSTVGYGYQIAAVSLFASWGYFYGFWTIWVPIFWALGFFLLKWLNEKGYLNVFYEKNEGNTIHGFLATEYNKPIIGKIAAFASILGLSGTAFFEAEFTSKIIANSTFPNHGNEWFVGLFLFFIGIALLYILLGGLKTVVATNNVQLSLGFIFFNFFTSYVFVKTIENNFVFTGGILSILSFLSILLLNIFYPKFKKLYPNNFDKKYSPTLLISLLPYIFSISYFVFHLFTNVAISDSISIFIDNQQVANVFSLGSLSMISLLLANGLWQIVDISSWQRLAAISNDTPKQTISKTLEFIGYYSAITWLIAIFFGMGLKYVGLNINDAWTALQDFASISVSSENLFDNLFVTTLFLSMIFIMFSTLDSLISAISYTVYYDIISKNQKTLFGARIWTAIYSIVFLIIYYAVRQKISTIDSILYTFYSFQLTLFAPILFVLVGKKLKSTAVAISILVGIIGTLIPLYINSETINPYTSAALFSVMSSTISLLFLNSIIKK
jgi:Na+/proline symporter